VRYQACLLCRKLRFFLRKSTKTAVTIGALFDSNIQQIVCRLGLCPRPQWGSLQRSPGPLAVFRGPTSKERRGGREFVFCRRKKKQTRQLWLVTAAVVACCMLCVLRCGTRFLSYTHIHAAHLSVTAAGAHTYTADDGDQVTRSTI